MAAGLSANAPVRERVRALAEAGLPVYAECGGFMYLCRALEIGGASHPMAGVFPLLTRLCARPQGLGYVEAEVLRDTPFFPAGRRIRGHEFHYSACASLDGPAPDFALRMLRGQGMQAGLDGIVHKNVFAAYTHIHALGETGWAESFVAAARRYKAA